MFAAYHRALTKRPILVQCVSTAALFGAGDVIAQQTVEKRGWRNHDSIRTLRMSTFGGIFAGPILSYWYRFVDKSITHNVASKAFFTAQGVFEGKSSQEIKEKLSNGYTTALMGNYKIWPAVQLINFYFTPLNYRLMVTNIVALGWNAYLSNINQKSNGQSQS